MQAAFWKYELSKWGDKWNTGVREPGDVVVYDNPLFRGVYTVVKEDHDCYYYIRKIGSTRRLIFSVRGDKLKKADPQDIVKTRLEKRNG